MDAIPEKTYVSHCIMKILDHPIRTLIRFRRRYNVFADVCLSIVFYHLFFRTLTFLYLPVHNFWLLLCPNALSYDWQMGSIPLLHSLEDPRACIAIPLFYGTLLLAFMSIFYQWIGNKMTTIRDVSKKIGGKVNKQPKT